MSQVRRQVGRYEIIRELGRGGMAVVYLAHQTGLDREVALKELAAFHVEDPAFVDRFLRESRLAGSLGHSNIVTVYDYFEHENVPYIAMEYLARGSLRPLVGHLTLAQVAGAMEGVLAGLNHAQRRSVVHRDLKPENLLITDEGGIKIADFGIAKALNQASLGAYRTATGMAIGTPAYMAPEQATAQDVGPWTDLYTTGVIAYELLVGRVPFGGVDTPMAVLWKHVHEAPPPPRSVRPDLDVGLASWLERMLAKDPASRPGGATAAWEELEEIVIGLLGPRWRRDARLLERGADEATPEPLTPATFYEEVTPDTPVVPADAAPLSAPPPAAPPPGPPPVAVAAQPPTIPPAAPPPADESFVWPSAERRGRGDLTQLAFAAGVLAATLLASGAIYLLTQDGGEATAPPPPPPPTATTPPPPPGEAFARFRGADEAFGGAGDQAMKAVASDAAAIFAGGVAAGDGEDAALWLFADGGWSRFGADVLTEPGDQVIRSVAVGEGGSVAVGSTLVDGDLDGAVWTSVGDTVSRVCQLESECGDDAVPGVTRTQEIFGVTATPGGFVAVGRDTDPSGGNFDAAVWRSSDGLEWERVGLPADGFAGERDQVMQDVVSTGTGLVAVGRDGLDAAVWRSPDGDEWERVASRTLEAPGAQEMFAIVAGGPGLVVVGYEDPDGERPRDAAVWVFDGIDWRRAATRALARPGGQEMRGLALVDGLLVAGGADRTAEDEDAAVWTSEDGLEWRSIASRELGGVGDQAIQALAASPDGSLAVGEAPSPSLADQDAAVWVPER